MGENVVHTTGAGPAGMSLKGKNKNKTSQDKIIATTTGQFL